MRGLRKDQSAEAYEDKRAAFRRCISGHMGFHNNLQVATWHMARDARFSLIPEKQVRSYPRGLPFGLSALGRELRIGLVLT